MTVYLGDSGGVELKRDSSEAALLTRLDPGDVNVSRKRFSVDFEPNALITGDQIEIYTEDRVPLELVDGHTDPDGNYWPDWRGFIHVDPVGGIRLYDRAEEAFTGGTDNALALVTPSVARNVLIRTRNSSFRCLARIKEYELTTSRETIQTTHLGDEFQRQFQAGLISGQGQLQCFWEHKYALCQDSSDGLVEFPAYLAYLAVRIKQGSDFYGRFFVYRGSSNEQSVWYEADCVVTNVVVTVPATGIIETSVQFVTNGEILLRTGFPPSYLLQEDSSLILQESNAGDEFGILLEDPT